MLPFMAKKGWGSIADEIKLRILGGVKDPGLSEWALAEITSILMRGRHNILGRYEAEK